MKTFPLRKLLGYVMMSSVVLAGLAGGASHFIELLPEGWHQNIREHAPTVLICSLAGTFIAAALASMLAAEDAEKALRAGERHRLTARLAIAYTACCIFFEVAIGKLGADMLGLELFSPEVDTIILFAGLTFFALAPRIVAWVTAGMEDIEAEKALNADDIEHQRTLDRIRVVNETTTARIDKGVADLEAERKSRGSLGRGAATIGAAAALLGAAAVDVPEATANVPIPFEERPQLHVEPSEGEDIRLNIPGDNWKRGPRQANRDTFVEVLNRVRERPESSVSGLSREFGIDRKTAKIWRNWALSIIDHPSNALLFDAA